ncbi:isocitrate dehydrogenase [Anaplasma bovis]|uniref:isocitrate dehydrogenase n=1 Tax=Anaplasma bovis TaxID=186733 RepID=UPI002FF32D69
MSIPISVAYGDGIGPEIMEAVLFILKEAQADISVESIEIGHKQYCRDWPAGISPSSWASINRTGVLLKAPTLTPQGAGHKSLNVALRKRLGLYASVRPCVSYHPVVEGIHPDLDIVVIRENEEDTYSGIEHRLSEDMYECVKVATRSASERICLYAFEYAKIHDRKRVTCLVKDNIMKMTDGILHSAFDRIASMYPDIAADHYLADIGMAKIAKNPEAFDVVVTTNLYGDILSDIVALLSGSIGLSGSANIGDKYSMFEAVHGSAPDISGQNIANPSGLLNAAVQMLIHIGQGEKAHIIYNALLKTLEDGAHTFDIYNEKRSTRKVTTKEFSELVVDNLGAEPKQLRKMNIASRSSTEAQIGTRSNDKPMPEHEHLKSKILLGVDVTIGFGRDIAITEVAESLRKIDSPLKLQLIHSKGMEIWPNAPYMQSHMDVLSCRFCFEVEQQSDNPTVVGELISTMESMGLDVTKMTKLYSFDGDAGFFVP